MQNHSDPLESTEAAVRRITRDTLLSENLKRDFTWPFVCMFVVAVVFAALNAWLFHLHSDLRERHEVLKTSAKRFSSEKEAAVNRAEDLESKLKRCLNEPKTKRRS